jgi:hypothetical protein
MSIKEKMAEIIELTLKGKLDEIFATYYHEDVVRQENYEDPRVGRQFNLDYEKNAIARVDTWNKVEFRDVVVDEEKNISMVLQFIDVTVKGQRFKREEVAVQRWKDGLIIHEKFYYSIEPVKA